MHVTESKPNAAAMVYAKGLFDVAMENGGQERVESTLGELEEILELTRQDPRFQEFLFSRIIAAGKRDKALEAIFTGRVSPMVVNFLRLLNSRERLYLGPAIVASFEHLVQNAFGRIEIDVYTLEPLTENERQVLSARFKELLGREPVIHAYTDPTMLGGIRVQLGDHLIDASIATSLRKLRDQLATSGLPTVRAAADRIIRADPSDNGH